MVRMDIKYHFHDPEIRRTKDEYNLDDFPDLYDRVGDLYGLGVFIAWIVVAYSVTMRILLCSSGADTVKLDFVATLIYPAAVAGHLVVQCRNYPGAVKELWTTTDKELVPYRAAIEASATVCLVALAINLVWTICVIAVAKSGPESAGPKKRLSLLGVSSLWIFIALHFPGFRDGGSILGTAWLFGATPIVIFFFMMLLLLSFISLVHTAQLIRYKLGFSDVFIRLTMGQYLAPVAAILLMAASVGYCGFFFLFYVLWSFMVPRSNHGLADLGQALAVVGGAANLGFSIYRVFEGQRKEVVNECMRTMGIHNDIDAPDLVETAEMLEAGAIESPA